VSTNILFPSFHCCGWLQLQLPNWFYC
jgi:hypothetical protein